MTTTPSRGIDQWRDYFRSANSDIFEIIERAILVAATDCPDELDLRRARIAEVLFTARYSRCARCSRVEVSDFGVGGGGGGGVGQGSKLDGAVGGGGGGADADAAGGSKESKTNSTCCRDDDLTDHGNIPGSCNYSYGDDVAEVLTDEIEEEGRTMGEVLRIKEILNNYRDEPDSALFDSLRRLQLMGVTINILKVTEIGKSVNSLRRHGSQQIRHLARALIEEWKAAVYEWTQAEQDIGEPAGSGVTPDSENPTPSVVNNEEEEEEEEEEEAGLPSPPLDEGALFATQNINFDQFFDGMDDDGNPRSNMEETNKNRERKPPVDRQNAWKQRDVTLKEGVVSSKDNKGPQLKLSSQSAPKPNSRPPSSNVTSGPGRPLKPHIEQKVKPQVVKTQERTDRPAIPRRPAPQVQRTRGATDENSVSVKLEAAKRKLQERYQEAEKAKKQRTIQVMEIQDLPKQSLAQRNTQGRFGNNRNWANGRR